jgi:glycosyltransferase involved in cell wall biosynthesis
MSKPAIHQITPGFFYGDAMGNQAGQIRDRLRQWGYRSQVYAQHLDTRVRDPGKNYRHYAGNPNDIVIYHHGIGSPLTEFVRQLSSRVILYYHNVTPPHFLRGYNELMAETLDQGRQAVRLFKDAPLALAASEYNREEMLEFGFRRIEILPYFVTFDELLASAESPEGREIATRYDDGLVNILFVGRLVPNKRQDDLIRAFNAYHHLVNPRSRLLLVGSEASAPSYRMQLEVMVDSLGLKEHVHMLGPVGPREGLGGYYQAADVLLCMSEHEGFCIPLVEAMAFDVPVVAYRSTGIPYALGGAGVLVSQKRYDVFAELIDMLVQDGPVRHRVIDGQRRRLQELAPGVVEAQLKACIEQILELDS